jgi:hypothetical protein
MRPPQRLTHELDQRTQRHPTSIEGLGTWLGHNLWPRCRAV